MLRQNFLKAVMGHTTILLAGCGRYVDQSRPDRTLLFEGSPAVENTSEGYTLTQTIETGASITIEDISIVAYSKDGELICQRDAGRLKGVDRKTVTLRCDSFPEIISAKAATSVCEDIAIPIIYWIGTTEQQQNYSALDSDEVVWKKTKRRCGEELPPERLLNQTS